MNHSFLVFCLALARAGDRLRPPSSPRWPAQRGRRNFRNLHLNPRSRILDLLRWQWGYGPPEEPALPPGMVPPYRPAIMAPDLLRINRPEPAGIQVTWIGHSTFLVQMAGLNLLTDPIWSERASPVTFAGPKRYAPPGLNWQNLPSIDAVVISHNHYDHLDLATVKRLGPRPAFFVPLGLIFYFPGRWIWRFSKRRLPNANKVNSPLSEMPPYPPSQGPPSQGPPPQYPDIK